MWAKYFEFFLPHLPPPPPPPPPTFPRLSPPQYLAGNWITQKVFVKLHIDYFKICYNLKKCKKNVQHDEAQRVESHHQIVFVTIFNCHSPARMRRRRTKPGEVRLLVHLQRRLLSSMRVELIKTLRKIRPTSKPNDIKIIIQ